MQIKYRCAYLHQSMSEVRHLSTTSYSSLCEIFSSEEHMKHVMCPATAAGLASIICCNNRARANHIVSSQHRAWANHIVSSQHRAWANHIVSSQHRAWANHIVSSQHRAWANHIVSSQHRAWANHGDFSRDKHKMPTSDTANSEATQRRHRLFTYSKREKLRRRRRCSNQIWDEAGRVMWRPRRWVRKQVGAVFR